MRQTTIAVPDEIEAQLAEIRYGRRFPSQTSVINYVLKQGLDAIARAASAPNMSEERR
ncbi:MAG: hypothetical protein RLZZ444_1083 [Pseudomonadota bacterium]|jgi:Arc/MetJ-type ribon-helix-helix transcriptional regulator